MIVPSIPAAGIPAVALPSFPSRPGFVRACLLSLLVLAPAAAHADALTVRDDGEIHISDMSLPTSQLLSPQARAYVAAHLKEMRQAALTEQKNGVPVFMEPYLRAAAKLFPVTREDTRIAGVHVYVYTPEGGVASRNADRVLINLHGGGFGGCWPGCAELESIPIAGVGKIKVVSVDYRQGPEHRFPAASEDVAAVYRELLKSYRPEAIGVYGCSAGAILTAEAMVWFQRHGLPNPGAIGMFCGGATVPGSNTFVGDSNYLNTATGEAMPNPLLPPGLPYFAGADPHDPLVSPVESPEALAKFPPTLFITSTRDMALSPALYTHLQLAKQGVETKLFVWEGLFHGFFYNPEVPESMDCYGVIAKFFDDHLVGR